MEFLVTVNQGVDTFLATEKDVNNIISEYGKDCLLIFAPKPQNYEYGRRSKVQEKLADGHYLGRSSSAN